MKACIGCTQVICIGCPHRAPSMGELKVEYYGLLTMAENAQELVKDCHSVEGATQISEAADEWHRAADHTKWKLEEMERQELGIFA